MYELNNNWKKIERAKKNTLVIQDSIKMLSHDNYCDPKKIERTEKNKLPTYLLA